MLSQSETDMATNSGAMSYLHVFAVYTNILIICMELLFYSALSKNSEANAASIGTILAWKSSRSLHHLPDSGLVLAQYGMHWTHLKYICNSKHGYYSYIFTSYLEVILSLLLWMSCVWQFTGTGCGVDSGWQLIYWDICRADSIWHIRGSACDRLLLW